MGSGIRLTEGQGAKAQQKRERNQKDKSAAKSQLKVVRLALSIFTLPLIYTSIEPASLRHPVPGLQIHLPQDHQGSRVRTRSSDSCLAPLTRDSLLQHAENKHSKTMEECFPTFQQ